MQKLVGSLPLTVAGFFYNADADNGNSHATILEFATPGLRSRTQPAVPETDSAVKDSQTPTPPAGNPQDVRHDAERRESIADILVGALDHHPDGRADTLVRTDGRTSPGLRGMGLHNPYSFTQMEGEDRLHDGTSDEKFDAKAAAITDGKVADGKSDEKIADETDGPVAIVGEADRAVAVVDGGKSDGKANGEVAKYKKQETPPCAGKSDEAGCSQQEKSLAIVEEKSLAVMQWKWQEPVAVISHGMNSREPEKPTLPASPILRADLIAAANLPNMAVSPEFDVGSSKSPDTIASAALSATAHSAEVGGMSSTASSSGVNPNRVITALHPATATPSSTPLAIPSPTTPVSAIRELNSGISTPNRRDASGGTMFASVGGQAIDTTSEEYKQYTKHWDNCVKQFIDKGPMKYSKDSTYLKVADVYKKCWSDPAQKLGYHEGTHKPKSCNASIERKESNGADAYVFTNCRGDHPQEFLFDSYFDVNDFAEAFVNCNRPKEGACLSKEDPPWWRIAEIVLCWILVAGCCFLVVFCCWVIFCTRALENVSL